MFTFKPSRRRGLLQMAAFSALAAASIWSAPAALAQDYPTKPITMIVPFSAGGTTDILARLIGQSIGKELGQSVVIDNRAGAGGNIGAQAAARARADGYTLFMGTVGTHAINETLYQTLPFDPVKDFQPLSRVAYLPNVLVANPEQPFKTVPELIAYAKANPAAVNFGSSGSGSSIHLSGELFKQLAEVDMQHIPYRGSAPAVADLLGNQVGIMFDNMPSVIGHIRAGKLVPIAVTTAERSPALPQVPTIAEAGLPGYESTPWFGLYVTAGTPEPIVQKLHAAITKGLNDPAIVEKFAEQGATAYSETPEAFAAFMADETQKWADVVKASGASLN